MKPRVSKLATPAELKASAKRIKSKTQALGIARPTNMVRTRKNDLTLLQRRQGCKVLGSKLNWRYMVSNYFNKDGTPKRQKVRPITGYTDPKTGKRVTRFSQIKVKAPGKIGPQERTRRGIALAIL